MLKSRALHSCSSAHYVMSVRNPQAAYETHKQRTPSDDVRLSIFHCTWSPILPHSAGTVSNTALSLHATKVSDTSIRAKKEESVLQFNATEKAILKMTSARHDIYGTESLERHPKMLGCTSDTTTMFHVYVQNQ